ncbi:MAG TPA: hypothetical protein VGO57_09045 [Verrucomicrobiae bacterium]|jgi:hypothetical protein
MITNIVAMLHTTAAYQAAALQLMVSQANFAAKQLQLNEPLPITVPADTNKWEVNPPPEGVGGAIFAANYSFEFSQGRLCSIQKLDWFKKISPPVENVLELASRPSLLDTNSACQLARQWLTSLSVNLAGLEKTSPPDIFQLIGRGRDPKGQRIIGANNILVVPLFMMGWGEDPANAMLRKRVQASGRPMPHRPPSKYSPVYVEILGTTKELLELDVRDGALFTSPALVLTNAAELLGPLPPPKHFVENLVGGKMAYEIVTHPDTVEAWLLTPDFDEQGNSIPKVRRTSVIKLSPAAVKTFSDVLADFNSYGWGYLKRCSPDYGVHLRFTGKGNTVDFDLCYQCKILEVKYNGETQQANFDPSYSAMAKAIQSVFPTDEALKKLNL